MNTSFQGKTEYQIVYADCPWSFTNKKTGGSMVSGADAHYSTMSLQDICNLPVNSITADDCVLFGWWVGSQPIEANEVLKAWGFRLITMTGFTWIKETKHGKLDFGMGFWTRAGAECCLIAVKGRPKRASAGVRSIYIEDDELIEISIRAKKEEHSKKPTIFRDLIVELCGDVPRIELFARQQSPGWDVFGNQVNNSIVLP